MTVRLPGTPRTLITSDGERLAGWLVPPPAGTSGRPAPGSSRELGILVAHGFSGSLERDEVQQIGRAFAPYGTVLLLTLRGHGRSSGVTTLGDREALDVDAGIDLLRRSGCTRVVVTGWSMGGSAVLRQAGLAAAGTPVRGHPLTGRADAVVAVSTTSGWFGQTSVAMRRLQRMVTTRTGRRVARHLGARVDPAGWDHDDLPAAPVEAAAAVDVPLLVVHGDADHYFDTGHARALVAAAGAGAELWEVPGLGHAEQGVVRDPALLARIAAQLPVLAGLTGPEHPDGR